MHPPPVVLQWPARRSSARAVHPVAAGAAECLRVVQEPQRDPGEPVQRAVGVGLSGGDDQHPGHVVGAVAVLGSAARSSRACSKVPRRSVSRSRWSNTGSRRSRGHASARRSCEERSRQTAHTRSATTGHASSGASRRASAAIAAGQTRLGQHPAQGGRQRVRIVVADDDARPAAEQLDGVRERGGDDGPAARDGVDQHTGGDLVGRVVGQDDDGGGLDQRGQRSACCGSAASKDTESATPRRCACSIRASRYASPSAASTFGCVRPATRYCGRPGRSSQRTHRLDHPLDALARTQQAPGQQRRPTAPNAGGVRREGRAMRDSGDFAAVDVKTTAQPLVGRIGHHNDLIRAGHNRLEDRTLVSRRAFQDSMGDHDRRYLQPVHDVHDCDTVDASVDTVLMLEDRDIALVQELSACCDGRR